MADGAQRVAVSRTPRRWRSSRDSSAGRRATGESDGQYSPRSRHRGRVYTQCSFRERAIKSKPRSPCRSAGSTPNASRLASGMSGHSPDGNASLRPGKSRWLAESDGASTTVIEFDLRPTSVGQDTSPALAGRERRIATIKVREGCVWMCRRPSELTACYIARIEQGRGSSGSMSRRTQLLRNGAFARCRRDRRPSRLVSAKSKVFRPLRVEFQRRQPGDCLSS